MTYTIKRLEDLPVLLGQWHDDFDFMRDARNYSADMRVHLDQLESPAYYILDMSRYQAMTLNELIDATNLAARGQGANFHHPMATQIVLVSADKGVHLSAEGLKAQAFGGVNTIVFESLDHAYTYIRENA